jgi:class 3 adenylate cyclase/predicted ATPase
MFCDLVGSTALAARLDPEELREVVGAYQETCAGVMARFEGYVAQYLGDGLLVYFGYPQAHEDDAAQAVRAGLDALEALAQLNRGLLRQRGVSLAVRIGVHTGPVVVGEVGGGDRREQLALGETLNLAARLQEIAPADTLVISDETLRLVQGLFIVTPLGPQALKGVGRAVPVYRVVQRSGTGSQLDVAAAGGLTPLVGREQELALLRARWEEAKSGRGQVVLLGGEAGIGKSRLVHALRQRLAGEPHTWLECCCTPHTQHSALYPVIDLLQRGFRFQPNQATAEVLSRLERGLAQRGLPLGDSLQALATLLALPLDERAGAPQRTPEAQRRRTLEALVSLLLTLARPQPLLLVVEDLHWVDPSTVDLLAMIVDQCATARLYVVLTFRPEFRPPWPARSHLTPMMLGRLSRAESALMVAEVTHGAALPDALVRTILDRTDGVPLFVEELTKMISEQRTEAGADDPSLAIPVTLQGLLVARLDRLGRAKEVAQLAATIGREFPYTLLRAVAPHDDATLHEVLRQLVEAELIYQRGVPPKATYLFKHALIQDAAYQTLLRSTRRQYHAQIAVALRTQLPETAQTQPELIAHHCTEAGETAAAAEHWQRAGLRAAARSANAEAIRHLRQALELVRQQPETAERIQQELVLLPPLGHALRVTRGYADPDAVAVYARARALCEQAGESLQLFPVLMGLFGFYLLRADLRAAGALADRVWHLSEQTPMSLLQVLGHGAQGLIAFYRGELERARQELETAVAAFNPAEHRPLVAQFGQDPEVVGLTVLARACTFLGYPDQGLARMHAAVAAAEASQHAFSIARALHCAALIQPWRRDPAAARHWAGAAVDASEEQGVPIYAAAGRCVLGWATAAEGDAAAGLALAEQGIAQYVTIGAQLERPDYWCWLAEVQARCGDPAAALRTVDGMLETIGATGERVVEAELHRQRGELLLQNAECSMMNDEFGSSLSKIQHSSFSIHHSREAHASFERALAAARAQRAKWWELRAATSLARLWIAEGRRAEACELLGPVVAWFTEGRDIPDVRDAQTLLHHLQTT